VTMLDEKVPCPLCGQCLAVRLARGRNSGKPFLMLVCLVDGRHFRGFITQREYVACVLARLDDASSQEDQP
jgi:hypothetical protein